MKKLLLFVFAALAFAACEQNPIEEQSSVLQDAPETLTVGFEGDETRIQLNEAQKTVWTKGDLVSVFYRSNANQQWKYDGETGARTAELKRVDAGTSTRDIDRVVVVYPYNEDYYINPETYNVQTSLPAVQNYLKDSYGLDGNIMISSSEYNQFSLKSVCGWLKLQLTGDGETIKSIKFRGNDGEQVAGELYINSADATAALASDMGNADDNNAGGSLVFDDTILTEVTLDCGEGVVLGKNATAFYIALPPQTFEKGFTVEITDNSDYTMVQSTSKKQVIERNHIQPMAAFEFINPATPSAPTPAANEIWYTATAKVEPTFDDSLTFGSDVVSNVWDSETKRGVIAFDGDVTMIGDDVFYNCDKLTGVTLPESVTLIGKNAFYDCDGLTEFTIPDSVTEIGSSAFNSCDKLTDVTIGDSVTTIGGWAFYSCDSLTSVNIPDSVTTIGDYTFCDCYSLTSVTIGDSVTSIGEWAFGECDSLTSVNIPDSVTKIGNWAFRECDSLTSVNIPDSVTTIGGGAFSDCESLTEFTGKFADDNGRILVVDGVLTAFAPAGITEYTIPDSVTTIGDYTFYDCYSLTSVTIGDSVTSIGEWAFGECDSLTSVNIPDSVTTIGEYAFWYCNLTSVNIPDSVTTIGQYAFAYCNSLKKVYCYATIPPSLGGSAFSSNASVRRIYVYDECVELYKSAWSSYKNSIYTNGKNCPETTTIQYTTNDGNTITSSKLPVISNIYENGVGTLVYSGKQIPNDAFYNRDSLTSVNIGDSVTSIGNYAFKGCDSLTSVTIGDSVTTIGSQAFYSCTSLTSVTIGNSVITIGIEAFENCTSLKEFTGKFATEDGRSLIMDNTIIAYTNASGTTYTIPDRVTTIGYSAFYNCDSLTSVNIPDSVTSIGEYAFGSCGSLKSVYCKATTPPALGSDVFAGNTSGRKIYVPASSVEAYKSATNWSKYASAIVGYDFENSVVVE